MKNFYLVLAVLGIAIPYGAFVPWLLENGLDVPLLFQEAIVNPISIFAWLDVLVSAVVLVGFIYVESKGLGIKRWWLALIGIFTVGVSFGLPFFLYLRELERKDISN